MPGATIDPGAGAWSRAMPLPVISTSRPALPACSMTSRMGKPTREGTRSCPASAMTTVLEVDEESDAGCAGACAGAAGKFLDEVTALELAEELVAGAGAPALGDAAVAAGAARRGSSLGRSLAAS